MKRKSTLTPPLSPLRTSSPVRSRYPQTRVGQIAELLQRDGVKADRYPSSGRVFAFLTDEQYVHDRNDESDIMKWCIDVGAGYLLCHLIQEWRPEKLCLRDCEGAELLETVIPTALEVGVRSLSIVNCVPADGDDSDDECDKFVWALIEAARRCEVLELDDCKLLSSSDLQDFLGSAAEGVSLSGLSLCRVSGMNEKALEQLANLLSTSKKLDWLRIGGLALCNETVYATLAWAMGVSTVRTLDLQGCDTRFLLGFLAALNRLPENTALALTQLDLSYTVPGDASGVPTANGIAQVNAITEQVSLLRARCPGLSGKTDGVRVVCVDASGTTNAPLAILAGIAELLRSDGVTAHEHPMTDRVLSFLTNKDHVHDARDEHDLIDWCIAACALMLLKKLLSQWRRHSVYFQNCEEPFVLEGAIPMAVESGVKCIALARCIPSPASERGGNAQLIKVLVQAARACDSLTLDDFGLLTPAELRQFLGQASEDCRLTTLELRRVSGMDSEAMGLLAALVLRSSIQRLDLREQHPLVLTAFLMTLRVLTEGRSIALTRLNFTYVTESDATGRTSVESLGQIEALQVEIALLRSAPMQLEIRSEGLQGAPEKRQNQYAQNAHFGGNTSFTGSGISGTPPDRMITFESVDVHEKTLPPPPHDLVRWNPRVVGRPDFQAALGRGLNFLRFTEFGAIRKHWLSLLELQDTALPLIVSYMTDGDPRKLAGIRELDQYHRLLWDGLYAKYLEALARSQRKPIDGGVRPVKDDGPPVDEAVRPRDEVASTMESIEAMLLSGLTEELIVFAMQLNKQRRRPPGAQLAQLQLKYIHNPDLHKSFLWAFNPVQAIEVLAEESRTDELLVGAQMLRTNHALPPPDAMDRLIDQYGDREGMLPVLWAFVDIK